MMLRRRDRRDRISAAPLALAAGTLAGALLLSACGGSSSATSAGGKVDVVAAFYPLQYLAEQIGGDHVKVTDLTAPGTEPHDLELTAKQVAAVQGAGAVLYLKGLQPTVDKAVAQAAGKHVVDAAALSPLVDHHLDEGTDASGQGAAHAGDPHIWLDPTRYAAVAKGVGAELAKADPAHAADYQRNTDALVAKLATLDQDFATGLKSCTGKSFVTSHAAFGYLADHYGLQQIAINGVDPESEPTPARLAQIQQSAKANGVTTIFFETLVSPKLADSVAKDLNLKTAVLDPLEGVKDEKADDYFTVMQRNLTNLQAALGCTA
ncbi:zinc ABC transporter substrate-binding protein [Streptomyces tateyamensis]|uniref:Zinc ABC transporter substrate-binding protein n=2 Tax=Streptomyces tateyamensis TaxID=565073 RepID=A0A2V4N137_9ACTN|nr:metal ABC transporter substrate-binding protein [Streptomyces tateyamensis]PYC68033.1 zinc ABC transporter substrate-binding protein [Streptomyces tateyamensis]